MISPNDKQFQDKLTKSIGVDALELSSDFLEDLFDATITTTTGAAQSVPVIGFFVGAAKTGMAFRDFAFSKKLIRFINDINKNATNDTLIEFREKLDSDHRLKSKTIETLCQIIDRLFDEQKTLMLSGMFVAYLDKKITWENFLHTAFELEKLNPIGLEGLKELADSGGGRSYHSVRRNLPVKISVLIGCGFVSYENSTFILNELGKDFMKFGVKTNQTLALPT